MGLLIAIPTAMIAKQPDLGTALLIAASGLIVMILAGLQLRIILISIPLIVGCAFGAWHFIHDYQRQRILTFLNPENDPWARATTSSNPRSPSARAACRQGYMNGSQAQLEFLPERSTDFIFAGDREEFGLIPCLVLLVLYGVVIGRALYLAMQGQDTFARLTGGAIALSFFVYVFVNSGMVSGILPVVGVPLPMISYGGTSMSRCWRGSAYDVAQFSSQTHRILSMRIVSVIVKVSWPQPFCARAPVPPSARHQAPEVKESSRTWRRLRPSRSAYWQAVESAQASRHHRRHDRPAEKAKPWFEYRPFFSPNGASAKARILDRSPRSPRQASVRSGVAPEYLRPYSGSKLTMGA